MPARDPQTGVPILGTRTAEDEIRELIEEKNALGPEDHDWVVKITYGLTNADAERGGEAERTGVPANPPIKLGTPTMKRSEGPLCDRCKMDWVDVHEHPCPGMSFEEFMASLTPEQREEVLAELARQQEQQGLPGIENVNANVNANLKSAGGVTWEEPPLQNDDVRVD